MNLDHFKIDIYTSSLASNYFIQLAWAEFFSSRQRGISLSAHFPWLYDGSEITYILISINNDIVGGLVIKPCDKYDTVAHVALVCIEKKYRGLGLFDKLMNVTIDYCSARFSALSLWTSQHEIYRKYGFKLNDNTVIAVINNKGSYKNNYSVKYSQQPIPTFADDMFKVYDDNSSLLIATVNGSANTICRYTGEVNNVISLIRAYPEEKIILNCNKDSSLLDKLIESDLVLSIKECNIHMWLKFDVLFVSHLDYGVLDRV